MSTPRPAKRASTEKSLRASRWCLDAAHRRSSPSPGMRGMPACRSRPLAPLTEGAPSPPLPPCNPALPASGDGRRPCSTPAASCTPSGSIIAPWRSTRRQIPLTRSMTASRWLRSRACITPWTAGRSGSYSKASASAARRPWRLAPKVNCTPRGATSSRATCGTSDSRCRVTAARRSRRSRVCTKTAG